MIFNVVCYAVPFALTRHPVTILSLFGFGFGIPACGYFGARNRSKPLVGCFWCCNICNLAILIVLLVLCSLLLGVFGLLLDNLPDYARCCAQFRACDWDVNATAALGCHECLVNQTDAPVVYMAGTEMCLGRGDEPPPPTAFQHFISTAQGDDLVGVSDAADESGSGSDIKHLCFDEQECRVLDFVKGWRVTPAVVGIFLALFVALMVPTVHNRCLCTSNQLGTWLTRVLALPDADRRCSAAASGVLCSPTPS